jgi:hypothetical protein
MDCVEIHKGINPPRIVNLGYYSTIMSALRLILKNDRDLMNATLVDGCQVYAYGSFGSMVADFKGLWLDLKIGPRLHSTLKFF